MSENREKLLEVQDLTVTFGSKRHPFTAVDRVSFDIYRGETFGLVGESGSGKTTIGRAIIRVNPVAGGTVKYKGEVISGKVSRETDRRVIDQIQMIFQDAMASLNERANVDYIVSEGLRPRHVSEEERQERVAKALTDVGLLPEFASRFPHEFSGGQRQRIGIARALAMEPKFLVLDEPISALDVSIRAQVLNLMKKFQEEKGITYLFIAHDLSVVRFISDRIGVIYKGRIVEIAEAEELFNFPLHPYTHSLISAIPIPDPKLEKNKALYTYDPSIHDYSQDKPELVCIGHDHYVYGSKKEIEGYKAVREQGIPVKPIKILDPNDPEQSLHHQEAEADKAAEEEFLIHPTHDTGSIWYMILSFFLPVLGLIGALLFKKFRHTRNYKQCRKGAVAGFVVLGVIVLPFLLLLWGVVA